MPCTLEPPQVPQIENIDGTDQFPHTHILENPHFRKLQVGCKSNKSMWSKCYMAGFRH